MSLINDAEIASIRSALKAELVRDPEGDGPLPPTPADRLSFTVGVAP